MCWWSDSHPWQASTRQHAITLHRLKGSARAEGPWTNHSGLNLKPSFTGHPLTRSSKQCTSIRQVKDSKVFYFGVITSGVIADTLLHPWFGHWDWSVSNWKLTGIFAASSLSSNGLLTFHTWAAIVYYHHHHQQQCKTKLYVLQIHTFLKSQHIFPSHKSNGIKKKHCRIFLLKYSVFIIILFFSQEALLTYAEPFITGELSAGKCKKKNPRKDTGLTMRGIENLYPQTRSDESSQPLVHATVSPAPWCHMNMTHAKKIRTKAIY